MHPQNMEKNKLMTECLQLLIDGEESLYKEGNFSFVPITEEKEIMNFE